jgi:hypothetical protein
VYEGQKQLKANFKFGTMALNSPLFVNDQALFSRIEDKLQNDNQQLNSIPQSLEISNEKQTALILE